MLHWVHSMPLVQDWQPGMALLHRVHVPFSFKKAPAGQGRRSAERGPAKAGVPPARWLPRHGVVHLRAKDTLTTVDPSASSSTHAAGAPVSQRVQRGRKGLCAIAPASRLPGAPSSVHSRQLGMSVQGRQPWPAMA